MDPGWLKAIDFGCAQQIIGSKPLTRRTGTPVYMVSLRVHCRACQVLHQTRSPGDNRGCRECRE